METAITLPSKAPPIVAVAQAEPGPLVRSGACRTIAGHHLCLSLPAHVVPGDCCTERSGAGPLTGRRFIGGKAAVGHDALPAPA